MKSKLKKESLIKAWKSRVPKKESDFTEKICEILHDYGLRMSGQSNPISETIEKTKHIIAEAWQDPSSKLGETIVKCLRSIRSCLLYTSPSPRDRTRSRMPSSA